MKAWTKVGSLSEGYLHRVYTHKQIRSKKTTTNACNLGELWQDNATLFTNENGINLPEQV